MNRKRFRRDASFTLIELLIVVGILGILSATVVLVLNPAELLKQGRDGRRVQEIQSLSQAVRDALLNSLSLGSSNTVYVSLPDTSPTCANLNLPALPSGWSYRCVVSNNLQKVDGTGWLPINLTTIPGGSPLSTLPIDPENNASSTLYYTYSVGSNNTYEFTALMESKKQANLQATDGGPDMAMYEAGSSLTISPFIHGLVGYWNLDEGSGTTAGDSSGNGINGSIVGSLTWRTGSAECRKGNCIETTGSGNYINIPYNSKLNLTQNVTYLHWVKIKVAIPVSSWPRSVGNDSHSYYAWRSTSNGTSWMFEYGNNNPTCGGTSWTSMGGVNLGTNAWHHLAAIYDGAKIKTYLDGAQNNTRDFSLGFCSNPSTAYKLAEGYAATGVYVVDEVAIYNRALSEGEIQAIYNATK